MQLPITSFAAKILFHMAYVFALRYALSRMFKLKLCKPLPKITPLLFVVSHKLVIKVAILRKGAKRFPVFFILWRIILALFSKV